MNTNELKNLEIFKPHQLEKLELLENQKNQLEIEKTELQKKFNSLEQINENLKIKLEEIQNRKINDKKKIEKFYSHLVTDVEKSNVPIRFDDLVEKTDGDFVVSEINFDEFNRARFEIEGFGTSVDEAVMVISGTSRDTIHPTSIKIDTVPVDP